MLMTISFLWHVWSTTMLDLKEVHGRLLPHPNLVLHRRLFSTQTKFNGWKLFITWKNSSFRKPCYSGKATWDSATCSTLLILVSLDLFSLLPESVSWIGVEWNIVYPNDEAEIMIIICPISVQVTVAKGTDIASPAAVSHAIIWTCSLC